MVDELAIRRQMEANVTAWLERKRLARETMLKLTPAHRFDIGGNAVPPSRRPPLLGTVHAATLRLGQKLHAAAVARRLAAR